MNQVTARLEKVAVAMHYSLRLPDNAPVVPNFNHEAINYITLHYRVI